ncbi:polymorphic toxin-type HINT domain-containing protein [Nonomuraea sp. NPDC052129]|uniref:polymorphic toxin-type HINT domain-containing protein n=1 Tax=Nonomuraea sp. NPDC052129 TaxID=3154651 RepID=UPI0034467E75
MVKLADGTSKAIEKIKPGDKVLATDPIAGKTAPKAVVAAFSGVAYLNLVQITVDIDGKKGDATGVILATEHHLFWDTKDGAWVRADQLASGGRLRAPDSVAIDVVSVATKQGHPTVHDLTVTDFHSFYVAAGDTPVLVHNCGVALGYRKAGTRKFAEDRELKQPRKR